MLCDVFLVHNDLGERNIPARIERNVLKQIFHNGVKMLSTARSSAYCEVIAFCGMVRMLIKSSFVSESSSTFIGKRPCNSGIRSSIAETWNAPAAMNRI